MKLESSPSTSQKLRSFPCYGMEMNVEKNKSNENFKTTTTSNNYDRTKTPGECGMF